MINKYGSIRIQTEKDDYTGGESVNGKVILSLDIPIVCRGVNIEFDGVEVVRWVTRGSGRGGTGIGFSSVRNNHRQQVHTDTVIHARYSEVLFGKKPEGTLSNMADAIKGIFDKSHYETLQPGHYSYDFSFPLPEGCPGDFETGETSRIRYELKAYVDIPFAVDFMETKKLTVFESFKIPPEMAVHGVGEKSFLLDSENPLSAKVTLGNNLYYPGDFISGSVDIENKSAKKIKAISISLKRVLKMTAHGESTSVNNITKLQVIQNPVIPEHGKAAITFECQLPGDVYATLVRAHLMKLHYVVLVSVDVPWAIDLDVEVPITILEEAGFPSGLKKK
jgi:sporulation-control protein spo0M